MNQKTSKSKTELKSVSEDTDEIDDPLLSKNKKPLEIDIPDEIITPIEEKTDEELAVTEDGEDASGDELSLDDDELNPFGDKWEQ